MIDKMSFDTLQKLFCKCIFMKIVNDVTLVSLDLPYG